MANELIQPFLPAQGEPFLPDGAPAANPLWSGERRAWSSSLVDHYLARFSAPGDLVLDPFASQAMLARAAEGSQRRLLLSHYSPATILRLSVSAAPPRASALDAGFSGVADAHRRGRTLAENLQALYTTICPECAQTCQAEYYVWDRASGEPVEKGYRCPHCQSQGRAPVDLADHDLVGSLEVRGAAYWGLLSRLVAPGDPETQMARSLMELYTPRALVAISELIAAVEQRLENSEEQRAGRALVLVVVERCISLQDEPAPAGPPKAPQLHGEPRQLHLPARFIEYNAWLAFEQAYQVLRARKPFVLPQVSRLQALLDTGEQGAVLLQNAAVQDLAEELPPSIVSLVLAEPPPLDRAAYALSYLWSGWLYGRKTATRLKSMLAVPESNWDWYARVMTVTFGALHRMLRPDGRVVLAFRGKSARLPAALLVAAARADLRLIGHATQAPLVSGDGLAYWRFVLAPGASNQERSLPTDLSEAVRKEAEGRVRALVLARGEPVPELLARTACTVGWSEAGLLSLLSHDPQAERRPVTYLADQGRLVLSLETPPPGLYPAQTGEHDSLLQWAPVQPTDQVPLADRVEQHFVELLQQGTAARSELEMAAYAAFPGVQTPDAALIRACLDSYAEDMDGEQALLGLRKEDQPGRRARERGEMLLRLMTLGHRLGYEVWVGAAGRQAALGLVPIGRDGPGSSTDWAPADVVWHEEGQPAHAFALSNLAVLSPWLHQPPPWMGGCPRHVVLPGGRAGLLAFKLRRCPAWATRLAETGWEFVKFRHVRSLAGLEDLTRAGFRARIGLDPIVALPGAQLTLFEGRTGHDR